MANPKLKAETTQVIEDELTLGKGEYLRQMNKVQPAAVEQEFPVIAKWVQGYGHIEIGEQEGLGFVVAAFDERGLVFEDNNAETLAEAMAALEQGLEEWLKDGATKR